MTHVFLVYDSTLAYCGCGGWVGRAKEFDRINPIGGIKVLGEKWLNEHYLPDVLQPGKDSTVGGDQ